MREPRSASRLGGILLPALLLVVSAAAPAAAQFIPYYGKNKVKYDNFSWRIYRSPHFEAYYYPEFEQHLARIISYAESSYQKVSSDLKHEISFPIPLILYKTHSEFEQTNLFPAISEGILAFAEPVRDRMVLPIDEPPDRLQGLITHELTHIFEFDLIPRNLIQRNIPLWVDEGLADYERGLWDDLDLMTVRDAAVTDQLPKLSRPESLEAVGNARVVYNLGHAAFEFIEARYGKEGIRQFLYTLRKNIVGGSVEDIYQQAFRIKPEEFDEAFDKWLKERFKPYRDKQRPSDYGKDLSPDAERTAYTQVIAFSPSPSGEIVAALTANRNEGEIDLVLLSAKDGSILKNLTSGYTNEFETIAINFNARSIGRSIAFDPHGDTVGFFARTGKRRSFLLASVISGGIVKRVPMDLDEAQAPCLLSDGRRVLFSALKEGNSDIFLMDLETGEYKNLTQDAFYDSDPQISPDGSLVVYSRRISGYDKIYSLPLGNPSRKTQLSFGTHDDVTPTFSVDGNVVFYASDEDDDIYNLRSLDLRTGVIRQYTDVLGGNMSPAPLAAKGGERIAFISYFKGDYRLQSIESAEPLKEVDQEVQVASEEIVDFQPDVLHQMLPQNKRKKGMFEKLFLEGRPPLNVGVTSGGDFFGGSQVALSDVLGDQNFVFTAVSLREFRSYDGTYINLASRLHWGLSAFDTTRFFFASPFALQRGFSREGAFATQRFTGALLLAQYPLDKFRRLDVSGGVVKLAERFENAAAEEAIREQARQLGVPFILNDGKYAPLGVTLVQETTRFREFGPLAGSTFSLGYEIAPGGGGFLSRRTIDVDARKYLRLGGTSMLFATRIRAFRSTGDNPGILYFGGNMELRGFPYLSFSGNQGFFANAELRFPIIDVMKTPLGILGPVRGTLYAGVGGAQYRGEPFQLGTRKPGASIVKCEDPSNCFPEPVGGYHLVDGRASYGIGLQFFFLGYPLHFDWSKLTDLKVASKTRFDFWVGFDF